MVNGNLPPGWVWKTLGEVCEHPQYGWTTSASSTGKLHLLRTTDITSGLIVWDDVPYCKEEPPDIRKYLLKDGDLVISRAGSVGYSILVKNPPIAVFASYLIRFRPLINERYISYFLQSPDYWQAISEKRLGIAIPNVNATKLKQILIPVSPLPEQERIVERIESLFTQLEAGVAALKRARAALKRYKASVLKAACEGRLVAQEAGDESAEVMLRRILAEKGEVYRAPEGEFAELPRGWRLKKIGDITDLTSGIAFKKAEYSDSGARLLQIANVSFGKIIWEQQAFLPDSYIKEYPKLVLKSGDLLMALNRPLLGDNLKIGILKELDRPVILYQRVGRFDFYDNNNLPYFFYFAQSSYFVNQLKNSLQGVDQPFINKSRLMEFNFPLPPLAEQRRIVAEVERRLSVVQELEGTVETNLRRAGRLRQAVLKRAFEGRLVRPNTQEEPTQPPPLDKKNARQLGLFE